MRYLAEAAFAQDHDEVEIAEFHAVLVAVGIIFGDVVLRRSVYVLSARTNLGSLR